MFSEKLIIIIFLGYMVFLFLCLVKNEDFSEEDSEYLTGPIEKEDYEHSVFYEWLQWETTYNYRGMPFLLLVLMYISVFIMFYPFGWIVPVLLQLIFSCRIFWWIKNIDGEEQVNPLF